MGREKDPKKEEPTDLETYEGHGIPGPENKNTDAESYEGHGFGDDDH